MNKRSPGSFCSLVVATTTGTSDSITSLSVAALGDGAEAYCIANGAVYRYSATSTQTTVGDTFLTPLSGGGCWAKQSANGDYLFSASLTAAAVGSSPASTGNWQAFPAVAIGYVADVASNFFTFNTTTGVITYTGPQAFMLVQATLGIVPSSAVGEVVNLDLSVNGALIGGSATDLRSTAFGVGVSGQLLEIVQNYLIIMVQGRTYQHVFLSTGAPAAQFFRRYQVTITKQD